MTSLFIATPLHDARMHEAYTAGLLQAWSCGLAQQWSRCNGTSLARQRDTLVANFLESDCTHILWVDSDIGWSPGAAQKLLDTGRDFVAGCYAKKAPGGIVPAKLLPNRDGELYEAEYVATGFLLVARAAVESMVEAFKALRYIDSASGKTSTALFLQELTESTEEIAFCRRWRSLGGQVWLHTGVVVTHFDGNTPYLPNLSELRKPIEAERLALAAE